MIKRWRGFVERVGTIDRPWRFAFLIATPIAVLLFPCLWLLSKWSAAGAATACAVAFVLVLAYTRVVEVPRQRRQRGGLS